MGRKHLCMAVRHNNWPALWSFRHVRFLLGLGEAQRQRRNGPTQHVAPASHYFKLLYRFLPVGGPCRSNLFLTGLVSGHQGPFADDKWCGYSPDSWVSNTLCWGNWSSRYPDHHPTVTG